MTTFAADLESISQKIGISLEETYQGVCIKLFGAVIDASPVDTGRFRGNWQTTVTAPASGDVDRLGAEAAKAAIVPGKLGEVTFLTNNLPYSERLENGYSGQAPQGMVRINVARFETLVRDEALKNRV